MYQSCLRRVSSQFDTLWSKKSLKTKTKPLEGLETTRCCFFRMESNSSNGKYFSLENHRMQTGEVKKKNQHQPPTLWNKGEIFQLIKMFFLQIFTLLTQTSLFLKILLGITAGHAKVLVLAHSGCSFWYLDGLNHSCTDNIKFHIT